MCDILLNKHRQYGGNAHSLKKEGVDKVNVEQDMVKAAEQIEAHILAKGAKLGI
jgi:hypothetical protein